MRRCMSIAASLGYRVAFQINAFFVDDFIRDSLLSVSTIEFFGQAGDSSGCLSQIDNLELKPSDLAYIHGGLSQE